MSNLSYHDKHLIAEAFPFVELSYDKDISYKKVFINNNNNNNNNNIYMIIPKGSKAFLWFTYWNNKPVCISLPLTSNNTQININKINIQSACFSSELSLQTIVYGTLFTVTNNTTNNNNNKENIINNFSCENIFYYKGTAISRKYGMTNKLLLLGNLFKNNEIKQKSYTNPHFIIGLPIINNYSYNAVVSILKALPYPVYGIKLINPLKDKENLPSVYINYLNTNAPAFVPAPLVPVPAPLALVPAPLVPVPAPLALVPVPAPLALVPAPLVPVPAMLALVPAPLALVPAKHIHKKGNIIEGFFKVKAGISEDNYELYCYDSSDSYKDPYDVALISTYKKSVLMNNIFRNIKENKNLDLLEESDNEEEFENINIDKFVDINKIIIMRCVYNRRFKKWEPIEEINEKYVNKIKLITQKELQQFY
jgi:hypothetical protein